MDAGALVQRQQHLFDLGLQNMQLGPISQTLCMSISHRKKTKRIEIYFERKYFLAEGIVDSSYLIEP